jgi:HTH-type transcriptional regulator/antitoxin HipB
MKTARKNNSKKIKTVAFTALEDKHFGKKGTSKRELYETKLNEEIIGELIRQTRQKQNLTQEELAKKLGVNKSNISKMENNIKSMRIDTLMKVLNVLDAKVSIQVELPSKKQRLAIA